MRIRKLLGAAMTLAGLETVVMTLWLSQGLSSATEAGLVTAGFAAMLLGYCVWGWHDDAR